MNQRMAKHIIVAMMRYYPASTFRTSLPDVPEDEEYPPVVPEKEGYHIQIVSYPRTISHPSSSFKINLAAVPEEEEYLSETVSCSSTTSSWSTLKVSIPPSHAKLADKLKDNSMSTNFRKLLGMIEACMISNPNKQRRLFISTMVNGLDSILDHGEVIRDNVFENKFPESSTPQFQSWEWSRARSLVKHISLEEVHELKQRFYRLLVDILETPKLTDNSCNADNNIR